MDTERSNDAGLKSVMMALDVLEQVANRTEEVGVSELAGQLGIAKGAIYRHLQTLVQRGYLWQNPETQRYRTGMQCHLLGRLAADAVDLVSAAEPIMRGLRDELGLTVTLAICRGSKIVTIERIFGNSALEIGVRPGSEFPLHSSSQGKIFLAFGKKSLWNHVADRKLSKMTESSTSDRSDLERQCAQAYKSGWAAAPEETLIGINAVAAPIFDATGACVASLAVVGSIQHLPRKPTSEQIEALRKAGHAISLQLGYRA